MNEEEDFVEYDDDSPSKSQRKRDMHALRDMGERLLELPDAHVRELLPSEIMDALTACRKITKGNARKRQMQYVGKLLRQVETDKLQALLDRFDASSQDHVNKFHKLERWRERLLSQDNTVTEEIISETPGIDRQHLRQLTRAAVLERAQDKQLQVQFRKLFQYMKSFEINASPDTAEDTAMDTTEDNQP
jgi:ribosome-associated protein